MNKWISKFRYICPFISVPIKDAYGTVTCNQEYAEWINGIARCTDVMAFKWIIGYIGFQFCDKSIIKLY